MTEEQKSKFCDQYCLWLALANSKIVIGDESQPVLSSENLQIKCDECPLNESQEEMKL